MRESLNLKVNYKWELYDIDLFWQIQKELLEKDYNGNLYINIALVREIARQLGWRIQYINTSMEPMLQNKYWDNLIHTHSEVTISIKDVWDLHWVADDLYKVDWLSRSCFPNMARVQALAVKNALKRAYPFFEADYLKAEDLAERWLIDKASAKDLWVNDTYNQLHKTIESAEKKVDLSSIVWQIKAAYEDWNLTWDEFKDLKSFYSAKYNSLWA